MNIENRIEPFLLCNQISLSLNHFAKGVFPCFGPDPTIYHVNRLFFVLENPGGNRNCIRDAAERHDLQPGEMYLAPAFHPVVFRLDDQVRFVSIHFNLELFHGVDLFSGMKRVHHEANPQTAQLLAGWFDGEADFPLALRLKCLVYEISFRLLTSNGLSSLEAATRFAPYREVLDYIATHCVARTRVDEFAAVMNLSREAFSRRFSADTGISPKKFFDRQLLSRATALLRRPRATAREVAYELQFSSEYVFSRFFKKQTGLTACAYRRQTGNPLPRFE